MGICCKKELFDARIQRFENVALVAGFGGL